MFRAVPLAFAQLADPSSRRVLLLSAATALGLLVGLVFGVHWLLAGITWFGIGWIDGLIGALGTLAALVLAWLLFPRVLAATTGLWGDATSAPAARPSLPPRPPPPRPAPPAPTP